MPNVISRDTGLLVGAALAAGGTAVCLYLLLRDEEWQLTLNRYRPDRAATNQNIITSSQSVINVKIPRESVGVVIGRQGSNIREIQAKTETRINFRDELETETHRVATIRGLEADVQMAEILIQQSISQQPRLETLSMTVASGCVGRIIGRQGDNIKNIQRISGARVDVDRDYGSMMERKVVIKGTSKQISVAKEMILEKVREEEEMRSVYKDRQPRTGVKSTGPLFLSYQETDTDQSLVTGQCRAEVLEAVGGDQCVEVLVSGVETPGLFYVQKMGPRSVELDKLTQQMTDFYSQPSSQELLAVDTVKTDDVVAAVFGEEENFYRARVVTINEDTYDYNESTVELFFVDYGDSETKPIKEIFELKEEYLKLKFQAIQCSLARVKPASGSVWTSESSELFSTLSHCALWKVVWAKINHFTDEGVAVVDIIDNNNAKNGEDINVGAELVSHGLAQWS